MAKFQRENNVREKQRRHMSLDAFSLRATIFRNEHLLDAEMDI